MHRIRRILDDAGHVDWPKRFALSHMALDTTTRCQQRCVYCFQGARAERRDTGVSRVRAMIRDAAKRCSGVTFMGAEPTLNSHIVEHVAYVKSLGLYAVISTNALRFKDRRFLDDCVSAGLDGLEISFPYPDEDVYSDITRVGRRGYGSLLQAFENIDRVARAARGRRGGGKSLAVGINVVVSQFNYRRLQDVLRTVGETLAESSPSVTMKAVSPVTGDDAGRARFRRDYFVPLQLLRESFTELLSDWPYGFPAIFRGYPLCVIPGVEDLAANLYYHIRGPGSEVVLENIHARDSVRRMHDWEVSAQPSDIRAECRSCSLGHICLDRFMLQLDPWEPLNRPVPSDRPARDVLKALGCAEDVMRAILEAPVRYAADGG